MTRRASLAVDIVTESARAMFMLSIASAMTLSAVVITDLSWLLSAGLPLAFLGAIGYVPVGVHWRRRAGRGSVSPLLEFWLGAAWQEIARIASLIFLVGLVWLVLYDLSLDVDVFTRVLPYATLALVAYLPIALWIRSRAASREPVDLNRIDLPKLRRGFVIGGVMAVVVTGVQIAGGDSMAASLGSLGIILGLGILYYRVLVHFAHKQAARGSAMTGDDTSR